MYINNIKEKFGNFNYAPENTVFNPTKYEEQLNYMIGKISTEITIEDTIAVSKDNPFNDELQNLGASTSNSESSESTPSLTESQLLKTSTTMRLKATKTLLAKKRPATDDLEVADDTEAADASKRIKLHMECIFDDHKTIWEENLKLQKSLAAENDKVARLTLRIQDLENKKHACIICSKQCVMFCGLDCLK